MFDQFGEVCFTMTGLEGNVASGIVAGETTGRLNAGQGNQSSDPVAGTYARQGTGSVLKPCRRSQCGDGKTISPLTGPETEPCAQTHKAECRGEPWTT